MFKKKNKSKIKTNNNSLKTLYQHLKGIPPSPNWGNKYSSIIFKDKYLIYISNSFIIVIDLENKVFSQILSSNIIATNDRLNVICSINEQIFIITNLGKLIIYQIINNKFVEDLDCENKFNINFNLNVKCFDYIENNNIIYTSNNSNFEIYNLLNDSIKKLISIPFKDDNSIMIIKHLIHNNKIYITLGLKNGTIEIFLIENSETFQSILKIESKKNMIFSLDYLNEILFSIDKNGTLKAYKIDFENKTFEILFIEKDKYNDKSINEIYLYFSIFCISNNKIIISSNQGRIFIYNYETKENKEISENPHKSSIF
jgi:WD40 repeat protein